MSKTPKRPTLSAYDTGAAAWRRGDAYDSNPFAADTTEAEEWEDGFIAAQTAHEDAHATDGDEGLHFDKTFDLGDY